MTSIPICERQNKLRPANTETDLLAIDRSGKEFLVEECKFKKEAFTYGEYLDTLAKLTPMKQDAKFHYALFSENGFDEKIIADAEKDGITLYDLEQIVLRRFFRRFTKIILKWQQVVIFLISSV